MDPANYQPSDLIEGYSSLIWTERFLEPGEFKLTTENIEETRSVLPVDTLLCIRESTEVAIVETHQIKTDDKGVDQLEVSGRTIDLFLEDRVMGYSWSPVPMPAPNPDPNKAWSTRHTRAFLTMQTVLSPGMPWSSLGPSTDPLPRVAIQNVSYPTFDPLELMEKPELAANMVLSRLAQNNRGIKNVRPNVGGDVITMVIYPGVDRTQSVAFRTDRGDIQDPSYLFSKKDYKNVAYVFSPLGSKAVYAPGTSSAVSGFLRRILPVNASDLKEVPAGGTLDDILNQKGWEALEKHNKHTWFDGSISPESDLMYKRDYDLGDRVRIVGKYGLSEYMQVTEYIRIQDKEGDRGYPTLIQAG